MGVVAWTTATNRDWFERNILAGYVPSTGSGEVFHTNARPWTWPGINDLIEWMKQSGHATAGSTKTPALELALAAATSRIAERVCMLVRPVDTDGNPDPAGDPIEVPPELHLAVLMTAFRWYRRASSPEGVIGASEIAGVVRTSSYDADVEALLSNYDMPGLA